MTASRSISLAALTVLDVQPSEMIEIAHRCGYSHVGLRPIPATPDEPQFPLLTDPAYRRDVFDCLQRFDVGVLDIEIFRLRPETVVADFEPALAFGAECGAQFALVAGNDPDLSRTADRLAEMCALANQYDIRPHIEFMPWTNVPTLQAALAVADACGHPSAGLLVDAFHLNRSGGDPGEIPRGDSRFSYVQLSDIAGPIPADMADILHEARAERLFPGDGDCPLISLLRRLPPGIPVSLEIPREGLRRRGVSAEQRARAALEAAKRVIAEADCVA